MGKFEKFVTESQDFINRKDISIEEKNRRIYKIPSNMRAKLWVKVAGRDQLYEQLKYYNDQGMKKDYDDLKRQIKKARLVVRGHMWDDNKIKIEKN